MSVECRPIKIGHVECLALKQSQLLARLIYFSFVCFQCAQALYKQMVEVMRGFGIEAVPTVGAPFDPEIHEAIMREPSEEVRGV